MFSLWLETVTHCFEYVPVGTSDKKRILLGTLLILISAGAYFLISGSFLPALVMCICGLALVPITFAGRSYAVKRMMRQYECI